MIRQFTLACVVGLVACGGSQLPPSRMADTQAAVSAATAVGAEQHPSAALHLKMARDQLQEARGLVDRGKDDQAKLVLDRANADAELALIITREADASQRVSKARAQIDALQGPSGASSPTPRLDQGDNHAIH